MKHVVGVPVVARGPGRQNVAGLIPTVRPADEGAAVADVEAAPAEPVTVESESHEDREASRYVGLLADEATALR